MKPGTCFHYSGLSNQTCEANHKYLSVAIAPTEDDIKWRDENYPKMDIIEVGIMKRVPCFARNGITTCPDFREPTPEEIKAEDELIERLISRVAITRKAIVEHCDQNKLPRGTTGTIPCPVCRTGTVQFSRAAYNGHIHARCTTAMCVQWME